MGDNTTVIKFDVGGSRYEVAKSLLEAHPGTMLTRMASDQWHDDSEAEIFIERDGERFKFCLDYLRDGKILLPITVRKEAVLQDLKYYNIEVQDVNVHVVEHSAQEKNRSMPKGNVQRLPRPQKKKWIPFWMKFRKWKVDETGWIWRWKFMLISHNLLSIQALGERHVIGILISLRTKSTSTTAKYASEETNTTERSSIGF